MIYITYNTHYCSRTFGVNLGVDKLTTYIIQISMNIPTGYLKSGAATLVIFTVCFGAGP